VPFFVNFLAKKCLKLSVSGVLWRFADWKKREKKQNKNFFFVAETFFEWAKSVTPASKDESFQQ
jgi:predicted ATPase